MDLYHSLHELHRVPLYEYTIISLASQLSLDIYNFYKQLPAIINNTEKNVPKHTDHRYFRGKIILGKHRKKRLFEILLGVLIFKFLKEGKKFKSLVI